MDKKYNLKKRERRENRTHGQKLVSTKDKDSYGVNS